MSVVLPSLCSGSSGISLMMSGKSSLSSAANVGSMPLFTAASIVSGSTSGIPFFESPSCSNDVACIASSPFPFTRPSSRANSFRRLITDSGMGSILNWSRFTSLPDLSDSILTVPVLFPRGSITTQSSVLDFSVLSVFGTVHCA